MAYYLIIIATVASVINGDRVSYSISKLKENAGILFEDIGETLFYTSEWNIFTTIAYPDTASMNAYLLDCETLMTNICKQSNKIQYLHWNCKVLDEQISRMIEKIRKRTNELDHFFNSRQKRGLINIIGTIQKEIFGTMDHEDSEKIYDKLSNLDTDNKNQLELLQLQASIMTSNFNKTTNALDRMKTNQSKLLVQINKLTNSINQIHINKEAEAHFNTALTQTTTTITMTMMEIQDTLESYIATIDGLSRNILYPQILSPSQISDEISSSISKQFKINQLITPKFIQKVAKTFSAYHNEKIFIRIQVPIPDDKLYIIHKVYLIPQQSENHFMIYDLKDEIIASKADDNTFVLMDANDLRNCMEYLHRINGTTYLCKNQHPIIREAKANCITQLLSNPFDSEIKNCKHKVLKSNQDRIIKMVSSNSWLLLPKESMKLLIKCNENETRTETVNHNSLLHVQGRCTVATNKFTLPYEITRTATLRTKQPHIFPIANISVRNENTITNVTQYNEIKLSSFGTTIDELHEESEKLENFQKRILNEKIDRDNREYNERRIKISTNFSIASLTTLIIAILVISFIIARRKRKSQAKGTTNTIIVSSNTRENKKQTEKDTIETTNEVQTTETEPTDRKKILPRFSIR